MALPSFLNGFITIRPSPVLRHSRNSDLAGVNPWSSQSNIFKIDTFRFLARHLTLLGQGKDWLALCQDNVTEWDIKSWCIWPGFPVGNYHSHHECTLSEVITRPDMTLDVVRMQNNKQTVMETCDSPQNSVQRSFDLNPSNPVSIKQQFRGIF